MSINMGTIDRVVRAAVAFAVATLYLTGVIGGTLALGLGVVAVVLATTGLLGRCPAYEAFGVTTRKLPSARG